MGGPLRTDGLLLRSEAAAGTQQLSAGRAFAWGVGEDGQLGLGNLQEVHSPSIIPRLEGLKIRSLVAGSRCSLALTSEGVYSWGWNQRHTLGFSSEQKSELLPQLVESLQGRSIVQAACGGWHCLALDDNGNLFAWGGNEYGQCGIQVERLASGRLANKDIETPTQAVPQLRVVQIGAGGMHSLVLTERGEIWTWGQPLIASGNFDQWRPARVALANKAKKIAAGAFHNLALLESGQVVSWGNGGYGQLGLGDSHNRAHPTPIPGLDASAEIVDIFAGGWHSAALAANGEVWVWGRGEHGRLGLGQKVGDQLRPVKLAQLAGECVRHLSLGGSHTAALTVDGRLFVFGRGEFGRLGRAVTATSFGPVSIEVKPQPAVDEAVAADLAAPNGWRVAHVSCGGRHTLALAEPVSTVEEVEKVVQLEVGETVESPSRKSTGDDMVPKGGAEEGGGNGEDAQPSPVGVLDVDLDAGSKVWGMEGQEEKKWGLSAPRAALVGGA